MGFLIINYLQALSKVKLQLKQLKPLNKYVSNLLIVNTYNYSIKKHTYFQLKCKLNPLHY